MIMAALYMYEKCTVDEISRTLKIDESIVKNEIAQLRECMLKIGKSTTVREKQSEGNVQMRKSMGKHIRVMNTMKKDWSTTFCRIWEKEQEQQLI